MRFKETVTRYIVSLICILCFLILFLSETNASPDTLKLEVKLNQQEFVLGEPVVVTMILTNESTETVNVLPLLNPGCSYLKLHITDSKRESRYYKPCHYYTYVLYPMNEGITLNSGESYIEKYNFVLTSDGRNPEGYTFPPGDYEIMAKYRVRDPYQREIYNVIGCNLESNSVAFQVVEAKGIDNVALGLFKNGNEFMALHESNLSGVFFHNYPSPDDYYTRQTFEEIVKFYSNSTYAKYAQFYLASCYWDRDYEKAIIEFQKVIDNYKPFGYTEDAEIAVAIAHHRLGDFQGAKKLLEHVVEKYPWSVRIKEATISLGECYINTHETNKARILLDRALRRYRLPKTQERIKEILSEVQ